MIENLFQVFFFLWRSIYPRKLAPCENFPLYSMRLLHIIHRQTWVFLDQSSTSIEGTPEMRRGSLSGENTFRHFWGITMTCTWWAWGKCEVSVSVCECVCVCVCACVCVAVWKSLLNLPQNATAYMWSNVINNQNKSKLKAHVYKHGQPLIASSW